ncbi:MAG: NADH-quinone oxidoreductase subunit A [Planctomycetota bacterium]|nr:MAG: NADH-quinone oxidoreductase subunit A [Planctomycetota bacterium]
MPEHALNEYLPVLMLLIFAISFAAGSLTLSWLLGKRGRRGGTKDTAFECGMQPFYTTRRRFSVKFYVVAMLFILFDIEVVFLYPWAITYKSLGMFALVEMLVFLAVLALGWVYVVRKGALDWAAKPRRAQS